MKRRPSSTRATSFKAGGIDLHQAVCGLDRSSYPVAQREVLGQHFFSALKRELGAFDALLGSIGRHPAPVGFHGVHEFLTHGGQYRSLMSGETVLAGSRANARGFRSLPERRSSAFFGHGRKPALLALRNASTASGARSHFMSAVSRHERRRPLLRRHLPHSLTCGCGKVWRPWQLYSLTTTPLEMWRGNVAGAISGEANTHI